MRRISVLPTRLLQHSGHQHMILLLHDEFAASPYSMSDELLQTWDLD